MPDPSRYAHERFYCLKQSRRLQEISGFKKIKKRYGRRRVE
jgi:hypothetical protein